MIFENVLYIPKLKTNILSLGKLDSQGCDIRLRNGFLTLYDGQGRLLTKTSKTRGNMYLLKLNIVEHCLLVEKNDEEAWLWHRRMCHQSAHTLHGMLKGNHAIGLPRSSKFEHKCSCCVAGKHARALFPKATEFRASKPLELVYADLCGPITPSTIRGGKYFLLIVDDFSRLMWVEILKNKSEAFGAFQKLKTLEESESNGALIKCLRTDHGGEFTSKEFLKWCEEKGIQRQLTTTYTPQQNGVVERKNRTVVSLLRSMLKDKSKNLLNYGVRLSILVCMCLIGPLQRACKGRRPMRCGAGRSLN